MEENCQREKKKEIVVCNNVEDFYWKGIKKPEYSREIEAKGYRLSMASTKQ